MKNQKIELNSQLIRGEEMKCWRCNIKMKEVKRTLPDIGLEYSAFECPECGEAVVSMKQLNDLAKSYKDLEKVKK